MHARSLLIPLLALVTSLGESPVRAQTPNSIEALLGIDLGVPEPRLDAALKGRGLACRPLRAQTLWCLGTLRPWLPRADATFELEGGRLVRVTEVTQPLAESFVAYRSAIIGLRKRVEAALQVEGMLISEPLPRGFEALGDRQAWEAVAAGAVTIELQWKLPRAAVYLGLKQKDGYPVLLLDVRQVGGQAVAAAAAAPPSPGGRAIAEAEPPALSCTDQMLMTAVGNLFPPATPELRAESARFLGQCLDPRAVGPLGVSMEQDRAVEVKRQAARALGRIGSPAAQSLLEQAFARATPEIKVEVVRALVNAGNTALAEKVAADQGAPTELRAGARAALATTRAAATEAATRAAARASAAAAPSSPDAGETPPQGVGPQAAASEAAPDEPPAAVVLPPAAAPVARPVPLVALPPPPPAPPARPFVERDGTALAVATSFAAGGLWGGGLSLLAQQNDVGVVTLIGGAGAVIGGGTAWGLTRFGLRPNAAQALWYANSVGWGSLAGLLAYSAFDAPGTPASAKLKYGLLVGGETLGIALGALSTRKWTFTPAQTVTADSLVLSAGLGVMGLQRLTDPDGPLRPSKAAALGAVPVMLGSAVASRYLRISPGDLKLFGVAALAAGWSGGLIGAGAQRTELFAGHGGQGGMMLGLGLGYLGAVAAANFVEVPTRRLFTTTMGLFAGNLIGLGSSQVAAPQDRKRWTLGAGLGGVGLGLAAFAAEPYLHPGPRAISMTAAGAVYGSASWALALAAASDGQPPDARLSGGMLAGGVAAGVSGFVASQFFAPDAVDQVTTAASTALGMSAGLGVGKLLSTDKGVADFTGVLAGGALGFGAGVWQSHGPRLRLPEVLAGGAGGGFGLLAGALIPSLGQDHWQEGRKTAGSMWLGLPLGALGAGALVRATDARGGDVAAVTSAGVLGVGMGLGAGWLWPDETTRAARIGTLAGAGTMLAAAGLLERRLHLDQGITANMAAVGGFGALAGAMHGLLAVGVVSPDAAGASADRQRTGALLLGTSAGLASGLVLGRFVHPDAVDYAAVAGTSVLGHSLGLGIARLGFAPEGDDAPAVDRREPTLRLLGAALGLGAGAAAARAADLRALDLAAGVVGTGYGALLGALLPTLDDDTWAADARARSRVAGGAHVGAALGGVAAATAAHLLDASARDLAVPTVAATMGGLGGMGFGLALSGDGDRAARIGTFAGSLGTAAGALALATPLRLREGFAVAGSGSMTLVGGGLGAAEGLLLASALGGDPIGGATDRQQVGGTVFGTALGAASGFVLARFVTPTVQDHAVALGGALTGASLARGLSLLTAPDSDYGDARDRRDARLTLAGSLGGLALGAVTQRLTPLGAADGWAIPVGLSVGGLVGALAPSLDEPTWSGWNRAAQGGLYTGAAAGLLAGVALRHVSSAPAVRVGVAAGAGAFGLMGGAGFGMLLDTATSRAARIGAAAGTTGTMVLALALARPLRLDEGFMPEGTAGLTLLGALVGAPQGLLLAGLLDDSGVPSGTSARQSGGGLLFGAALGGSSGFLLARIANPSVGARVTTIGGGIYGVGLGLGAAMLANDESGRPDTAATLAGSLAGMTGGALLARYAPLQAADGAALPLGTAFGGLFGALLPSLDQEVFPGLSRDTGGGLLLGSAAGGVAAIALRKSTSASGRGVAATSLGGVDGLVTGLGVGWLLDDQDDGDSRITRRAVTLGTALGLGLGATVWPRQGYDGGSLASIAGLAALGAWNGAWVPVLGHASGDEVKARPVAGGALAGLGGLTLLGTAIVPRLQLDADLVSNALAMDALLTGAGAGVGALVSQRFDAPAWGLLGGGAAGLVLGAALHEQLEIGSAHTPLLLLAPAEGLWFGAWLPHLLIDEGETVSARQRIGGLAAGGLGAAALAALASPALQLSGDQASTLAATSAIGASIAGGAALLADDWRNRKGVGLMLGGTGAGLLAGVLLTPKLSLGDNTGAAALGTLLGASEGLVFAWAGRAESNRDYAGAGLVGAGLGAGLGLAAGAGSSEREGHTLPAAGFAAWGAWMGAFGGALANRDPHEVTLGGVAGANLGLLAGYGLDKLEVIEPRDFGWLSLFGAAGTALGGGAGALLSSSGNPRPVLLGLAIGPAIGLGAGAIVLPRMKRFTGASAAVSAVRPAASAVTQAESPAPVAQTSSEILEDKRARGQRPGRRLSEVVKVTQWMPLVGALPAPSGSTAGPAPFVFGLTGLWQ